MKIVNTPMFSVIVTCFNKAETIKAAITSAKNQGEDTEVIVVDDCSTDGSRDILKLLEVDKVVLHESNKGALGAYLTGMRAARGRYLVMLDGDDQLAAGILPALSQADLLDDGTCVRLGMATLEAGAESGSAAGQLTRAITFRPGRLFTLSQSTGGTAYVFSKTHFDRTEKALAGVWPQITVQDHVLPGIMGLQARRFIKLKTVGYYMAPAINSASLGGQKTVVHHDRLLSDHAIVLAAEGPLRQKFFSRFWLRLALVKRMRALSRRYGISLPPSFKLFFPSEVRTAAVENLAQKIRGSGP